MARKHRRKRDESVIRTERDSRRAKKENDDTFDLTDEDVVMAPLPYTTAPISRYLRCKARKFARGVRIDGPFPFLRLPPEIRNMIYERVLVSKAGEPIRLDERSWVFTPGGIETAILLTNRKIYNEAIRVLYDRNMFRVQYDGYIFNESGPFYRLDNPRDASKTSRQLRSGLSIDMVNHRGLIYKDVFFRLRNVEFYIDMFERGPLSDETTVYRIANFNRVLQMLYKTIEEYSSPEFSNLRTTGGSRTLVVRPRGLVGPRTLENSLTHLFAPRIVQAVLNGDLKVVLKGPFPFNWESIFADMMGMLSLEEFSVSDTTSLDPTGLEVARRTM